MTIKKAKRSAAIAGVRASLRSVNRWVVAGVLNETARALLELVDGLRTARSFEQCLSQRSVDPWTLPDAAWQSLLEYLPELRLQPLGEATERAVKKTLAEHLHQVALHPAAVVNGDTMLRRLQKSFAELNDRRLLERFLAFFFFELAIDAIRRGRRGPRYHFTSEGRYVPLKAEREWREMLARQCDTLAAGFAPVVEDSLKDENIEEVEKRISLGLGRSFGRLPGNGRTGPRDTGPVYEVSATSPPAEESDDGPGFLRLIFGNPGGNVSISPRRHRFRAAEDVPAPKKRKKKRSLEPLEQDLIELGAAVYMTDLKIPRQSHLGRRLRIEMAVRRPEVWEKAREEVEHAVSFLARDDFHIQFVERQIGDREIRLDEDLEGTCVCLFSGGLDSLAGAVRLLEDGELPLLVSHYANGTLAGIQNALVDRLAAIYDNRRPDQLGFYVARSISTSAGNPHPLDRRRQRLMPQALRAFLFLSLASAVAIHRGLNKVYIPENGPLALNPIFSEARTTTRSVHPGFLAAFERMIRKVFDDRAPRIENSLLYFTKGEVVSQLKGSRMAGLVELSNSCWNWARVPRIAGLRNVPITKGTRHDGECLPCVGRRVAVHAAGIPSAQDVSYLSDVFARPIKEPSIKPDERRTAILDYLRFCERLTDIPDEQLLMEVPDFSLAIEGVDHEALARMARRGAREFITCFDMRGKPSARQTPAEIR